MDRFDQHLALEVIADLLSGKVEQEILQDHVLPHLLRLCSTCTERVEQVRALQHRFDHWDSTVVVGERQDAAAALSELEDLPPAETVQRVYSDERFHTWVFCQLLLERCLERLTTDAARAAQDAELAVIVSEQLAPTAYHPDWVGDLRARAWAYLGNARRVLNELQSAEADFRRADEILRTRSTGRPEVLLEILAFKVSLYRDQGRYDSASGLLDRALACARDVGDRAAEGRLRIAQARIYEATGDADSAIEALHEALPLLEPGYRGVGTARFNLACFLVLSERFEEAREVLESLAPLFAAEAPTLDRIRFRWAEGAVAAGLGEAEAAEAALLEARDSFAERDLGLDAGLVSLDLARLYLEQGRRDAIREVAAEVVPLFHAQDLHREAVAALLLFQRAVHREELTAELLRELAATLRRRIGAGS